MSLRWSQFFHELFWTKLPIKYKDWVESIFGHMPLDDFNMINTFGHVFSNS